MSEQSDVNNPMTDLDMINAFNEWMRRYTEHPEQFEAEFRSVALFCAETATGKDPSYGLQCMEYLKRIHVDIQGGGP